jgi:hypothetical protein
LPVWETLYGGSDRPDDTLPIVRDAVKDGRYVSVAPYPCSVQLEVTPRGTVRKIRDMHEQFLRTDELCESLIQPCLTQAQMHEEENKPLMRYG